VAIAQPKQKRRERSSPIRVDTTRNEAGRFWRHYLRALGPGLVTGASDDDPSGIATYAQAGAQYRFGFLWAALITLPMMAAVQEICDRTALATGESLGALAVRRFTRWGRRVLGVLLVALIAANALNISADLAVMGDGAHLLHLGPSWPWSLAAGIAITALLVSGSFHLIAKVFKLLCLALLAYLAELLVIHIRWGSVAANTFVPHVTFSAAYLALLVAVLGTTISPYLFFWQSAHRIEELREEPEGGRRPVPLEERTEEAAEEKERASRADVFSGMGLSNLVMFAIIVATAATLGAHGRHDIGSAAQAAAALKPLAGHLSSLLFSVGIMGAGALAVPVLAASGSAGLSGLLGKKWGFSRSPRQAPVFYGLVTLGTVGGTLLTLVGINTIKLLVYVALINGLAAAPFLVVVMLISGDRRIMHEYRNGPVARTMGWLTMLLMGAAAVALIATGGGL
jgi:NRAMP (natural resistance-associated macrophage protein)-like metal ion transporter